MKTFLLHVWSRLRGSFWFIPGLLVASAIIGCYSALAIDRHWGIELVSTFPQLREVSADGVRSLLSTAATSVLMLAGITFSSTLVALTLASSQFGGRLLRNFIRSMPNQIALGVLLGNFVFCLIILRSVRSVEDGEFIPHIAALIAFVATLGSLVTFISFIHHIATSLQADTVVSNVYAELEDSIEKHFPDLRQEEEDGSESEDAAITEKKTWDELKDEVAIGSSESGYIQAVAIDLLVGECAKLDLRCRLLRRPGQFVNARSGLLALDRAGADALSEDDRDELSDKIIIGRVRTAEQDFEYCIRQLVEISLRALSPGINDPFTAMTCIDFLGAALAEVSRRKLPNRNFCDEKGVVRVRSRPAIFADLLDAAFHQIRQTAGSHTDIALRLLGSLAGIGASSRHPGQAAAVLFHAELIAASGHRGAGSESDAEAIAAALEDLKQRLGSTTDRR